MKKDPNVRCPTCQKQGAWFGGPYGPFCSRRCKLVDLGKWLNEEHAISEPLRPDHFVELPETESGEPPASPKIAEGQPPPAEPEG